MRLPLVIAALVLPGAVAAAPPSPAVSENPAAAVAALANGAYLGTWENPAKSVTLRVERCGEKVCGTVATANDKARADARRGGTDPLVGVQLFEEFTATDPRVWRGRVFVPDQNLRITGTATLLDPTSIRVRGCAPGGIICRSQVWTRIAD